MGLYSRVNDVLFRERGETSTLGGSRASKDAASIHLLGDVDELNSHLGLVKALLYSDCQKQFIEGIQKNLMKLMSHVSDIENEEYFIAEDDVDILKSEIDSLAAKLPKQSQFVLPGTNTLEAQTHIARAAARRAERQFVATGRQLTLCPNSGVFLNVLSNYLFILSRTFV